MRVLFRGTRAEIMCRFLISCRIGTVKVMLNRRAMQKGDPAACALLCDSTFKYLEMHIAR